MTQAWKTWGTPPVGECMFVWHAGRCAWCGTGKAQKLVEDHCHMTGLTRALLCSHCNTIEGKSADRVWDDYRNGDHPAAAMRYARIYRGWGEAISPSSVLHYYSRSERESWMAEQCEAIGSGAAFPTDAPWTPNAEARRDFADAQLRDALAGIFGGAR